MRTLTGEALKAAIEDALTELDRLEDDVTTFFLRQVSPDAARAYQEAILDRTFEALTDHRGAGRLA